MENIKIIHFDVKNGLNDKQIIADARLIPNGQGKPLVLFVHGFKGFKDWGFWDIVANMFAEAGFIFIKINLSHNGTTKDHPLDFDDLEAFGNNNFTMELADINKTLEFLAGKSSPLAAYAPDTHNINIIGHSRGGAVTAIAARENPLIKKLVLWAAVHNLEKMIPSAALTPWKETGVHYIFNSRTGQQMPLYYQLAEDYYKNSERFSVEQALKSLSVPCLIVHGTADETLPVDTAREMHRWKPDSKLKIIEGAGHTFGGTHPWNGNGLPQEAKQLVEVTLDFLLG